MVAAAGSVLVAAESGSFPGTEVLVEPPLQQL